MLKSIDTVDLVIGIILIVLASCIGVVALLKHLRGGRGSHP